MRNDLAPFGSQLNIWYHRESDRRLDGLKNEIDLAEIESAFRGSYNKWYKLVKKNTELFASIKNCTQEQWYELLKQRDQHDKLPS